MNIVKSIFPRITPAGAGKTLENRADGARAEDHPRRCGENPERSQIIQPCQGSPPQVRGKLDMVAAADLLNGITPAGAGKTKTMALLWVKS